MTINKLMADREEITLVAESNGYGLRLVRKADGRIDLADEGCRDTGSDFSDTSRAAIMRQVCAWLTCVEWEGSRRAALAEARQALGLTA